MQTPVGDPCAVVEFRRYAMKPGGRDRLIAIFEREFLESQEALGMTVIGQFRAPDEPDRFVWLRGFPDMAVRDAGLRGFYGGPVWKAHREAANDTMLDSDDVFLLRPAGPRAGFRLPSTRPDGIAAADARRFVSHTGAAFEQQFLTLAERHGGTLEASYVTEPSKNSFPALPVRENENVAVWFVSFADEGTARAYLAELRADGCDLETLLLEPADRSRVR